MSERLDVYRNRDTLGEHVVDGRASPGLLHQAAQHLRRRVAGDLEADPDALVAVPYLVGQPEDAQQVDVTLHAGPDFLQLHTAGRGDVGQTGGEASGDRVQR